VTPGYAGGGKRLSSRQAQYVVTDLGDWATYKLREGSEGTAGFHSLTVVPAG
jgi:hypothetical protein